MRLAMAQISSGDDPSANLHLVESAVADAAGRGAELVVFPEATMCRFGVPLGPHAQPVDGPWASAVSDIARAAGVAVVVGMFTPADDGRVRNTVLVAGADGKRSSYDKIHLYDAFGFAESATVEAGTAPVVARIGDVAVGIATCYDIRFPALFTTLAAAGAQLIVVPASWGAGEGKVHQWQVLATARALDATTYVAAVGQASPPDPEVAAAAAPTGVGHSQLTDPFGTVVAAYDGTPQVGVHDIDLGTVRRAQETLAVLANQRDITPPI